MDSLGSLEEFVRKMTDPTMKAYCTMMLDTIAASDERIQRLETRLMQAIESIERLGGQKSGQSSSGRPFSIG